MKQLKELEILLHQGKVRSSIEKLRTLLHPDFVEIGYSGKTYDFQMILEALTNETPSKTKVYSHDYSFRELASVVVLVTYLSARQSESGELTRHAKRSSVWVAGSNIWQIKFHQATPILGFKQN